jgi:hypothetical protein
MLPSARLAWLARLATMCGALTVACRSADHARATLKCPAATPVAALSADSTAGICLPSDFARVRPEAKIVSNTWKRGRPGDSTYAWIATDVLDSAAAALEWGVPPRPTSLRVNDPSDGTDQVRADSVVSHPMVIDGRTVDVETALLSGGFAGMQRQPHVRAVWPVGDGRWVIVQGEARTPQQVDVLRGFIPSFQLLDVGHR